MTEGTGGREKDGLEDTTALSSVQEVIRGADRALGVSKVGIAGTGTRAVAGAGGGTHPAAAGLTAGTIKA